MQLRAVSVNLDRVKALGPLFYDDYNVILHCGTKLTLGRHFRERLEKLIGRPVPAGE